VTARASLSLGDISRAESSLKHAIELDPSNLEVFQLLEAALDQFDEIARRGGQDVSAGTMAAMILETKSQRGDVRDAYERLLAKHPDAAVAANNLAWIYQEEGRVDEALRLALIAKSHLRRSPQVNDTLGWIYLRLDRPLEPSRGLKRVPNRSPITRCIDITSPWRTRKPAISPARGDCSLSRWRRRQRSRGGTPRSIYRSA
jgi:tetratricopeptide (TPR) repeat protein